MSSLWNHQDLTCGETLNYLVISSVTIQLFKFSVSTGDNMLKRILETYREENKGEKKRVGMVPTYLLLLLAAAKSLQSCPTLFDPTDGSPPGFPIPGILQARTLECVAISFSNAWKWKVKVKSLSRILLLATPGTAAYQTPPSMGFSRQEYWSGVPLPSPPTYLNWPFFSLLPFLKMV